MTEGKSVESLPTMGRRADWRRATLVDVLPKMTLQSPSVRGQPHRRYYWPEREATMERAVEHLHRRRQLTEQVDSRGASLARVVGAALTRARSCPTSMTRADCASEVGYGSVLVTSGCSQRR